MVNSQLSHRKRNLSPSASLNLTNHKNNHGKPPPHLSQPAGGIFPSPSLKKLTNNSANQTIFGYTIPISVDNQDPTPGSQLVEGDDVGFNIIPRVIPIPKPKLLINMIPESELFQRPDGGTLITPHLLRAQKEYIRDEPKNLTTDSELVNRSPTDKLVINQESSHKIQFGNLLKDNWNELLKSISLTPTESISTSSKSGDDYITVNNIGTPLSKLLASSISPPNITSEYRETSSSAFEILGLINLENNNDDYSIIKHFFNKLLPLVSACPNPPWIKLSLQYVDPSLCKSCFLSLGCVHLIGYAKDLVSKQELLNKSGTHINKVLDYLLNLINDHELFDSLLNKNKDNIPINVDKIVEAIEIQHKNSISSDCNVPNPIVFQISFLLFIHILYGILDHGRSAISRLFFKLFASLLQNFKFRKHLELIDPSNSLISMISWWDNVSALSSADFRLPYTNPRWFYLGSDDQSISTIEKLSGCPSSLFICMSKLCQFRQNIHKVKLSAEKTLEFEIMRLYSELRVELLDYRMYVNFHADIDGSPAVGELNIIGDSRKEYFKLRLKVAQCWSLAMMSLLINTAKFYSESESERLVHQTVLEFIDVYSTLDLNFSIVQKLVWPLFQISLLAKEIDERNCLKQFLNVLFNKTKCLNITTLLKLLQSSWDNNEELNGILTSVQWNQAGIALLAL